jgi:hypothetical protein
MEVPSQSRELRGRCLAETCSMHLHRALSLVLAATSSGCLGAIETGPMAEIDEDAILAKVAMYRDLASFDPINAGAYPSALGTSSMIELYALRETADMYATINPVTSGSGVEIPEGGIIVREVLDTSGTAQRLTVMAKGPTGYNPELGDWYFAVTDLSAVPIIEDGLPRTGRLADCFGCHVPRMADDFLFGVPMAERSTGVSPPPPPQGQGTTVCGDFACEGGETRNSCPRDCRHRRDRDD